MRSWLIALCLVACAPELAPPPLGDYDGSTKPPPGGGGADGSTPLGDGGSTLTTASSPKGIVLVGGLVYYTNFASGSGDGTVSVVSTSGGTPQNLATAQNGPWALTVAGSVVFFTLSPTAGTGGVSSVATTGGTVTPLQQQVNGAVGIVNDGVNLFWTLDSSGVIVETVPLLGGTGKQLLDFGGDIHPQGLSLFGAELFVPTTGTQAAVLEGATSGTGNLSALDTPSFQAFADVAAGTTTVYATLDDIAPNGAIIAYPRGTGSPVNLATGLNHPQRLALDGNHLYFTDPNGGNVWVIDVTTTNPPTLFASGLDSPLPIAVADAVYVGTLGAIVRIAKL